MDGLDKGRLLSLVCDRSGVKGKDIGKIDVKGAYSFFEVDQSVSEVVRQHLHGFEFKGRIVRIELTGDRSERPSEPKERRERKTKNYSGKKDFGASRDFKKKDYPKKDYRRRISRRKKVIAARMIGSTIK